MSVHSPGPWHWSFFCRADGQPIQSVDDVAETIAGSARHSDRAELFGVTRNSPDGRSVVCYTGNGPNSHNNALLIAAAPELLEALRELLDAYVEENGGDMPTSDGHPAFLARDVIAKAEGK